MNNISEIIKKRKSTRTYNGIALKPEHRKSLEDFFNSNNKGIYNDQIDLFIKENKSGEKQLKINYGLVSGQSAFMLAKVKSSVISRVNYGYVMEKTVLKATELGISTCWIGYFDSNYFTEVKLEKGFQIPAIVIMGYSGDKPSIVDRLSRFSANSAHRKNWEQLFFEYGSEKPLTTASVGRYADSLEMLRLAPSSGNTQPWRIFFDANNNKFHFYKEPISKAYEAIGLHDVDMGIAISHFELMCAQNGLKGTWEIENMKELKNYQYIISWKSI